MSCIKLTIAPLTALAGLPGTGLLLMASFALVMKLPLPLLPPPPPPSAQYLLLLKCQI